MGIILFMLLAGEPPFYSSHCDDWTMQKILNEPLDINGPEWDDISAECKDFVSAPQFPSTSKASRVAFRPFGPSKITRVPLRCGIILLIYTIRYIESMNHHLIM